jgi:hypothetical protein
MEEIIPNLWISNLQIANDLINISNKNIQVIVNCSRDYSTCNVKYNYRVPVVAAAGEYAKQCEILYNYIPQSVDYIHNKIMDGYKVLVCCPTGRQQSATIIVAYIMKYGLVSLQVGNKYITSKYKGVFQPEMIFKNSLEMYQKYLIQ